MEQVVHGELARRRHLAERLVQAEELVDEVKKTLVHCVVVVVSHGCRTAATAGEVEQLGDDEERDLVLHEEEVVVDVDPYPPDVRVELRRAALALAPLEQELEDEAAVEHHHLHELVAPHLQWLAVAAPRPRLHRACLAQACVQVATAAAAAAAVAGVLEEEIAEEPPLVALHGAGAAAAEVVRADGHHARLVQALVLRVDVGRQAHDGEGLVVAAAVAASSR
ncbi:Os09g0540325, partial [Oryza sativa Japonica Group]